MKLIKKYCLVFIFTVSAHSVSATQDLVYGIDIKNAAEEYLNKHNVDNQVVISKNRAFFPCKQKIFIAPKRAGNYTTLKASCDNPASWTITVRTKIRDQGTKTKEGQNSRVKTPTIVFAKRNIPKDQVIQYSDLVLKPSERKNTLGAYINIDHIIGHKSKKNIARGTVLKARHIEAKYSVNKSDTILIVSTSSGLQITTYGEALSDGKLGDMILVRNISSNKKFKAVITAEKKVSPVTNIN
mgnify:CR=1 FL=1